MLFYLKAQFKKLILKRYAQLRLDSVQFITQRLMA